MFRVRVRRRRLKDFPNSKMLLNRQSIKSISIRPLLDGAFDDSEIDFGFESSFDFSATVCLLNVPISHLLICNMS